MFIIFFTDLNLNIFIKMFLKNLKDYIGYRTHPLFNKLSQNSFFVAFLFRNFKLLSGHWPLAKSQTKARIWVVY